MKPLTVFSAFDGAGIGLLALNRAGVPVSAYYASEVDKYAIQIAKKNHPEIIHAGDVKQCWARNFPQIDLLIGGSPCQDLSVAKKDRQGLKGPRSKLFWHYVRLLRTMKPRWWMLENVASMSKADRAEITAIFGVEPVLINSALVSAQQRKRLYWTNIPNITQPEYKGLVLADILENGLPYEEKAKALTASYGGAIIKNSLERKQRSMVFNPYNNKLNTEKSASIATTPQCQTTYTVKDKQIVIRETACKIDLPDGQYTIRKLTPIECERLQTWPDGYTEGVSNTQRYKMIGNGWTADVTAHIFSFIPREEETND